MSESVTVSAPGKLMLLGEHAVVYNRPCLVTAVDQRLRMMLKRQGDDLLSLDARDVGIQAYDKPLDQLCTGDVPKGARFVEFAVRHYLAKYGLNCGVAIESRSQFGATFGFGSSSASAVAVVKGLAALTDMALTDREVFDLAYQAALDVQGMSSGFDIAAAVYGGTLYFETGGKVIEPLTVAAIPLIVGYTGTKADTVQIVKQVRERALRYPQMINSLYDAMADLVRPAKAALLAGDWSTLGDLMNFNQGYLEALGVSSFELARLIHAARDTGAFGAKLSGGGIGDCMITLVAEDHRLEVMNSLNQFGQAIEVRVSAPGVLIEEKA